MPLFPGDKLGPYEILAPIGAGGMGEVYRARDTRLGREVAIKTSKEQFTERFEREGRAVAALNHPNIAQLYDIGALPTGAGYMVMEYVEGAEPKGPLPVDEVLKLAEQIASALDAAHEKGITHRDLKPANIKIKPDGTVKVLDFGLAKLGQNAATTGSGNPEVSPTLTLHATEVGMILGTAGYMSPEQARGKHVDRRADIWAFGVVLYELLTGKKLFTGEDVVDILAAIVKSEPDISAAPPQFHKLLTACLQKDPKQRLQSAGDWKLLLTDDPGSEVGQAGWGKLQLAADLQSASSRRAKIAIAVAALFALATAGLSFIHFREKPPAAPDVMRFQIELPDKVIPLRGGVLSPDGRKIVFRATSAGGERHLYLRSLDSLDTRVLPAGEEVGYYRPFWSPDSRFVAFEAGGKVKKIDVTGGPPQTLCDIPGALLGGSWDRDGIIIFGSDTDGVMRVSAGGGVASPLTGKPRAKRSETYLGFPAFLPDSRHFVYHRGSTSSQEPSGVYIGSVDSTPDQQSLKQLVTSPVAAVYTASSNPEAGTLLFLREGALMAQPFDVRHLQLTGEPVVIAEGVGVINNDGFFSASENGALLYRGGKGGRSALTWLDRQGKSLTSAPEPFSVDAMKLSPDAGRVALSSTYGVRNIWLFDFSRGTNTRFTLENEVFPAWSPDGSRIAFKADRTDKTGIYQKESSGAGGEELLSQGSQFLRPTDWSSDGHFLLYYDFAPGTNNDLWVLPYPPGKAGEGKPIPFLRTQFNELQGRFSPDTRYIAYQSDESGKSEIYVRPFNAASPAAPQEGKWMVSRGGGTLPRWRRDGKELYFQSADGMVMAVDVSANPVFQAGVPKALFPVPQGSTVWDSAPDGQRFLFAVPVNDRTRAPFTLVLNWQAGLKK